MFPLFQAGKGRYSNNYELYRESLTNPTFPGGGGWSAFQLSLGTLYTEHERLLNWWTQTNKHLNLVRYLGLTIRFYRQPDTDYVATYQTNYPFELTKYHYMSSHPERLLMFNHKVIVPSFKTAPQNKKTYIKKHIKPPREFLNKWYFQNQFSRYGLVMITCAACSLDYYYINPKAQNNTVHLWSLNTKIFQRADFKQQTTTQFGYYPKSSYYMYAAPHVESGSKPTQQKELIYLGNTNTDQPGQPFSGTFGGTSYTFPKWGNPFYYNYIDKTQIVFISTQQPTAVLTNPDSSITASITEMQEDILTLCSYNPHKDKGYGNKAFWYANYKPGDNWKEPGDPDIVVQDFPLWILLWGWEDFTKKMGKLQHLDTDYLLVINSDYITPKLPAYIFLSDSFQQGQGPYHTSRDDTPVFYTKNWYPSWQYQKEAIEEILMSGPGTCKRDTQIQAHMHYTFRFKWGGAPAFKDPISDPTQKPDYPLPNNQLEGPEIEDPKNDPTRELYSFDTRRDIITMQAAKRIKRDKETELFLFTDGSQTAEPTTSIPIQQPEKKKRKKTQTKAEKKATLQQQLQFFRNQRHKLQLRYQQLTKQLTNLKSNTALSE